MGWKLSNKGNIGAKWFERVFTKLNYNHNDMHPQYILKLEWITVMGKALVLFCILSILS